MYLVLGIICILVGAIILIWPRVPYNITESWRSSVSGEPSLFYIVSTRIVGALVVIVGIMAVVGFALGWFTGA